MTNLNQFLQTKSLRRFNNTAAPSSGAARAVFATVFAALIFLNLEAVHGQNFTRIIVTEGGGLACSWADYDNDGFQDLFVTPNSLFRNNRNGTFTKITSGPIADTSSGAVGGSWGDYDNDGYLDLFVVNSDPQGNNFLYHNEGNGNFTSVTAGAIVNDGGSSLCASWGDYDYDGYLDLFVARGNGQTNLLYHNNGDGTFTKVTAGVIVTEGGASHSSNWIDYDNDGDLDLFVANRGQKNYLYRNDGFGVFTKITGGDLVNEAYDKVSSSWADYDNDGDLDVFIATGDEQNDLLYRNEGNGIFTRMTAGPVVNEGISSQCGSWADFDNDGDLDLFVSNLFGDGDLLYRNDGSGNFTRLTNNVVTNKPFLNSHGNAWADYDNDGDVDLFVTTQTTGFGRLLYRNENSGNSWVNIKLIGTFSNTAAIGAKVRVKATINGRPIWQMQQLFAQTGFLSQNSLNAEFGLGNAARIDTILVEWPSGYEQILTNQPAKQFLTITEERPNQPPFVNYPLRDVKLVLADPSAKLIIDLEGVFADEDEDKLNYTATSSAPAIAAASVSGSILTIAAKNMGTASITVIADDGRGGKAETSFNVTVVTQNARPRVLNAIPDQALVYHPQPAKRRRFVQDLTKIFIDDDKDVLSYSASSSNVTAAVTSIRNDTLQVIPVDTGRAVITVRAGDGNGGEAETKFNIVVYNSIPPKIIHTGVALQQTGRDIRVDAKIVDEDDSAKGIVPSSVLLHYRIAGLRQLSSAPMTISSQTIDTLRVSATIPASAVTERGVEYFIVARDTNEVPGRAPLSGVFSVRVRVDGDGVKRTVAQPSGTEQTGYHLVSIPLEADNQKPEAVLTDDLGAYDDRRWRFYEWRTDSTTGKLSKVEFPNTADMAPGKAFWLIIRQAGKVLDTGPGVSIKTSEKFSMALHKGWNLVGNPFNFPAFAEIVSTAGAAVSVRTYEGEWRNFDLTTNELEPFKGYAVFCDAASTLQIDPQRFPIGSALPKSSEEQAAWAIGILAHCQEAKDTDNLAAVITNASRAWDVNDHPEPPGVGEYVSVYFSHPEWQRLSKTYCTDFRPAFNEIEEWDFAVETNMRDEVKLSFDGVENVPLEYDVWLVDKALKISRNLRQVNSYSVAGRGPENPKHLTLIVSKRGKMGEKYAEYQTAPTRFELSPNFPNPFNPATTIRYALPKAETVTLQIYNLLGEVVATLVNNERKEAGYHAAIWNGRNAAGNTVANGVYFYRLRAGSFAQTRKMVLVE